MLITIAGFRKKELESFIQLLKQQDDTVTVNVSDSESHLLQSIKLNTPTLVIFDEGFAGKSPRDNVITILQANAFIHTAILSSQDQNALHDILEGLGVVSILPVTPTKADATALLENIRKLEQL